MKITLENTSKIVEVDGVPARIWEGTTEKGIPIHALIVRVVVDRDEDSSELDRELKETRNPSAAVADYPIRLIL